MAGDGARFNWEDFTFADDAQRLRFFEAVDEGDYEEAERICDAADEMRFGAVN